MDWNPLFLVICSLSNFVPSTNFDSCGGIFIQVICRYYKWGKSLGVLICWAFTVQDYLFKEGRRSLAAGLVDINRFLLLQILWKALLLSPRLSYLCTDEGCKPGFAKIALECKVCENGERKRGREWSIRNSWIGSGSCYGKTGIWGTWSNVLRSKGNLNVKCGQGKETFSLWWWVYMTLVRTSPLLLAPLPACGLLAGIFSCCNWKKNEL